MKPTIYVPFYVWFWGVVLLKKDVPSTWNLKHRGLQDYLSFPHKTDDSPSRAF